MSQGAMRLSGECPQCSRHLVRKSRKSDGHSFISCSGFPSCRFSESIDPHISDLIEEVRNLRLAVTKLQSAKAGSGVGDKDIRRVIAFAHPDKWPNASELAHGVVVMLNELRERK